MNASVSNGSKSTLSGGLLGDDTAAPPRQAARAGAALIALRWRLSRRDDKKAVAIVEAHAAQVQPRRLQRLEELVVGLYSNAGAQDGEGEDHAARTAQREYTLTEQRHEARPVEAVADEDEICKACRASACAEQRMTAYGIERMLTPLAPPLQRVAARSPRGW